MITIYILSVIIIILLVYIYHTKKRSSFVVENWNEWVSMLKDEIELLKIEKQHLKPRADRLPQTLTFQQEMIILRLKHNEHQAEMAKRLGVSSSYLSGFENGTRKIPQYIYERIEKEYGLKLE